MKDDNKTELFEQMPIPKAVLQLSIPTIMGTLVMVLYNLADTYFVGMLNDPIQNAAVTLAAPVLLAFNAVNNLFGVGGSSMMSRALGRKDYETVSQSSAFVFYCSLVSGVLFSLLSLIFNTPLLHMLGAEPDTIAATSEYLKWTVICGAVPAILNVVMSYLVRSEGAAMHASIGAMSGCLLNIVLDPIFILPQGLGMGSAGAGLATFISNCVACLYFLILIWRKRGRTYVCIDPRKFAFRSRIVREVFGVGIPASIQNLLNVVGMTILNNFMASYGSDAVAAMGIAQKINMIPMYVSMGFSQGIMPLISYNYASGNHKRMKKGFLFAGSISIGFIVAVVIGYFFGAGMLIQMFMDNEVIIAYGTRFLRAFCLGLPFLCIDFMAVGVFQAVGMGKHALVFAIMRKLLLEIPAIYILDHFIPMYGLAYSQFAAELVLAVAAVIVLVRFFAKLEKDSRQKERAA